MGSSVNWLPLVAGAALALGPALAVTGCGGSGGGGRGMTAGGVTGPMTGLAVVPEETAVIAAPGSFATGTQFQLAVDAWDAAGDVRDVTRQAMFASSDDQVARVGQNGLIEAVAPGTATITVSFGGQTVTKEVEVSAAPAPASFSQVKVYPAARVLADVSATASSSQDQQLVVVGIDQGKAYDLTRAIGYTLNDYDPSATAQPSPLPPTTAGSVSPSGLFTGSVYGEDVLVQVELTATGQKAASVLHLGPGQARPIGGGGVFTSGSLAGSTNPIDVAVLSGLQAAGVAPAPDASDGEFLRRLYSDALYRLPTQAETEAFLAGTDPDKRSAEVDRVVALPEFAARWGMRLGEWFTINDVTFDGWAAAQLTAGRTIPQIVSDLITGTGQGGQLFDARHDDAGLKVDVLLLAGMGFTAECAKCHNHPVTGPNDSPRWLQGDRYPLDAFFAATRDEAIPLDRAGNRTGNGGQPYQPGFAAIDPNSAVTSTLATPLATRRQEFAGLFVAAPQFARGMAHRIFADVAQPLLDPNQFLYANLSAMKAPAVLDALQAEFTRTRGDLKAFLSTVFKSKAWQLGSEVSNPANDGFLSRRVLRRQQTEGCASLVQNVTGAAPGQLGFFQQVFGYPLERARIDERSLVVNISQSLVLQNSPAVQGGLAGNNGVPARLAADVAAGTITMEQAIGTLWVRAYSRPPAPDEVADAMAAIQAAATPRAGLEDVAAALLASIEAAAN